MANHEPVVKTITVNQSVENAFHTFTEDFTRWWPLRDFSVSGERAARCFIEPRVGGMVAEERDDGSRFIWGKVLAWEPPARLVMTWHPGRKAEGAQEIEVTFHPVEDGTRVELRHTGWEKLGEHAEEVRKSYDGGWNTVFTKRYGAAAGA